MNTEGDGIEMEAAPVEYAVSEQHQIVVPQPQTQVVMVQPHHQTVASGSINMQQIQQPPYQPVQAVTAQQPDNDMSTENYLYAGKVGDLTICHWIACLFCNCCNCALIGFILNEFVNSSKQAGYHKLAYHTSQKAKCWMIAACVCSLLPWIMCIIIIASPGLIVNSFDTSALTEDNP